MGDREHLAAEYQKELSRIAHRETRDTPTTAVLDSTLSEAPEKVDDIAGSGRGKGIMPDERDKIVGALASIGQQLLDLANEIKAAGGPPSTPE